MSDACNLGEQTTYEGLVVAILDEGQGTFRIQIVDGPGGLSSTCAGYTPAGIRERALELAYSYLLKRDGSAAKPAATPTVAADSISDLAVFLNRRRLLTR